MLIFLKSIGFGLAVAAPVGPMSLICMRRTLAHGPRWGFATGAGIALADTTYAFAAALGLAGLFAAFLHAHQAMIQAVAGLILIAIGARFWFAPFAENPSTTGAGSIRAAFASAYALTLANPPTLLTFAAMFAAFAPGMRSGAQAVAETTLGVLAGSMLWWLGLVSLIARLHHVIGPAARKRIGQLSALCLIGFGVAALLDIL